MNASGRPNTCKSNGNSSFGKLTSGARVRNAYAICLVLEYSPGKLGLILHSLYDWHHLYSKGYGTR
nr:hypothetical protein [uncultured bacterium]AOE08007.1 hypothetical protein [uncultured bacterium]AOE08674.1 hypothetical protein [uncultured bacterium]